LLVTNDVKGNRIGVMKQTPGFYESYIVRNQVEEKSKGLFFEDIQKRYDEQVKIKSASLDSLMNYEDPISIKYEMELDPLKGDVAYINPMFAERWKKNPFTSTKRYYPVEMPYTIDDTYLLTIQMPEGYTVDEMPKQMVLKLDDKESAVYDYRISESGSTISLRSQLKINRTMFTIEEYESLRQFFSMVVNKQSEQIVLKKNR